MNHDSLPEPPGPPPPDREDRGPGGLPPPSATSALAEAVYFFGYLRPVRLYVVGVVLASLLASLLRLPVFYLPVVLTSHFTPGARPVHGWLAPVVGSQAYLHAYIALALACLLVGGALSLASSYWSARASEHMLYLLRRDVFARIEGLSMKAVYTSGPGEFVQRLARDLYMIRDLYGETFTEMLVALLQVGVYVVAMFRLDPWLTAVLLPLFALVAPVVRLINGRVERMAGRLQQLNETILSQLVECIGGYRDIRASGRFDRVARRFGGVLRETERSSVRTTLWAQIGGGVLTTVTATVMVIPYLVYAGSLRTVADAGRVITYVGFLAQVLPTFSMLARATSGLAMSAPSLRAVRGLLDPQRRPGPPRPGPRHEPDRPPAAPRAVPTASGDDNGVVPAVRSIRFEGVGLFLEGRWLVQDLTFEIPGGKLTAIVGQSGAGKTTIFHLLLRLAEPTCGTIWINDRPLSSFSDQTLRKLLGFIPQNPFLFNDSIRENLALALPDDDGDERVLQAVALAELGPMIEARQAEGGLDAVAGYMGMRLSAGERQRIALARLLIQDPSVIVCDEYTANIDVRTARLIEDMMRSHFAGRTRVVITHELYSIKGADHIIVVERGRIERAGDHARLVAQPGLYRTLWEAQSLA
jgi:ATP-binding cassette subfamily B protein